MHVCLWHCAFRPPNLNFAFITLLGSNNTAQSFLLYKYIVTLYVNCLGCDDKHWVMKIINDFILQKNDIH